MIKEYIRLRIYTVAKLISRHCVDARGENGDSWKIRPQLGVIFQRERGGRGARHPRRLGKHDGLITDDGFRAAATAAAACREEHDVAIDNSLLVYVLAPTSCPIQMQYSLNSRHRP
ncbi:hypothetical protein U1Q18_047061 [Sarracenia purpurea var. burkii]